MTILTVANRLLDLSSSVNIAESTQVGGFDPAYCENALATSDAYTGRMSLTHAPVPWVWYHFRIAQIGSVNGAGSLSFVSAFDAAGLELFRLGRTNGANTPLLLMVYGSATVTATGSVTRALNTTTTVDISVEVSGGATTVNVYFDGALALTATNTSIGARGQPAMFDCYPAAIRVNTVPAQACVSEVIVSTDATIAQRLATMKPVGAGIFSEMTGSLDDLSNASDLDGLVSDAPGQRHTWVPSAYNGPDKPINALVLSSLGRRTQGTPSTLAQVIGLGGTLYAGADVPVAMSTPMKEVFTLNPATGQPWVVADLATLEVGLKSGP